MTVTTATTDANTNTDAVLRAATDALAASADVVVDGDSGAAPELPRDAATIAPPRRVLYSGSCFCGEVTVRCFEKPRTVSYCHCSICRKLTGAPFSCQVSIARCSFSLSATITLTTIHSPSPSFCTAFHFRLHGRSLAHTHPPRSLPICLSVSLISASTALCVKAVFQSTDVSIELEPGGKLHSFNTSRSVARHRCVTCMSPVKATLFNGKLTAVPLGLISSWRGTGEASSSSAPGAARPANSDEETQSNREEGAAGSHAAHAATRESAGTGASAGAASASNTETEADGEPEPLRPLHHIHYSSRVVDVVDGLPKYASTVREVAKGKGGHGGPSGSDRKGKGARDTKARGGRGNAQRSESQSAHQTEGVEVNTNTEGEPALELVGKMVPETD